MSVVEIRFVGMAVDERPVIVDVGVAVPRVQVFGVDMSVVLVVDVRVFVCFRLMRVEVLVASRRGDRNAQSCKGECRPAQGGGPLAEHQYRQRETRDRRHREERRRQRGSQVTQGHDEEPEGQPVADGPRDE